MEDIRHRLAARELAFHVLTPDERRRVAQHAGAVFSAHAWIQAAYLFGSAARTDRPVRDIDVALLADPAEVVPGFEARVAGQLADRTGIVAVPFDVRLLAGADPVFVNRVLSQGRLLHEADRRARIRFEARAMAQWLDFRPVWLTMRRAMRAKWGRGI